MIRVGTFDNFKPVKDGKMLSLTFKIDKSLLDYQCPKKDSKKTLSDLRPNKSKDMNFLIFLLAARLYQSNEMREQKINLVKDNFGAWVTCEFEVDGPDGCEIKFYYKADLDTKEVFLDMRVMSDSGDIFFVQKRNKNYEPKKSDTNKTFEVSKFDTNKRGNKLKDSIKSIFTSLFKR